MQIKLIAGSLVLTAAFFANSAPAQMESAKAASVEAQKVQHIRNATIKITYGNTVFLIDPMLAEQGAYPGFPGTYRSELRNPLVALPMSAQAVIQDVDAVVVTHTHLDHWDEAAQKLLPKDIPLFTQDNADAELIRSQGFTDVHILEDKAALGGVTLSKTGGQHGSDALYSSPERADVLGNVMGVVFQAPGRKTIYVAGDTVWRSDVEQTFQQYHPEVIVLNTGAAVVSGFEDDPIILGQEDTRHAYEAAPNAFIIAVHMDAVNHMTLSREQLAKYVQEEGIQDRVLIPADGEVIPF